MYICACDLRHVCCSNNSDKSCILTSYSLRGKEKTATWQGQHNIINGPLENRGHPLPPGAARYVSESHSQQIKMSWTATTLTGMEGTDIRHIKRINHPRASCSRRGVADHSMKLGANSVLAGVGAEGAGVGLCAKHLGGGRDGHKERNDCIRELFQQIFRVLMYWCLCAWALAANIINSVKATNSRAIDGSPNDWEDKQMHSCRSHKMAALYLKALFSQQQLGNNYGGNARKHIACVSQF